MITGNKGEWSELYVLIRLLADGKLHQSDIDLSKDENNIYEIIKAYKSESEYKLEFQRDKEILVIKDKNDSYEEIGKFSINSFDQLAKKLFTGIKEGKGRTFSIESLKNQLDKLHIKKIKANSQTKADISLRIYDHRLAKETDLGFSIKSLLGGDSTLFNTGYGNNFIFNVTNNLDTSVSDFNKTTYAPENGVSKITTRLKELKKLNCKISYKEVQSKQLWRNLKMIDGDLPAILAQALYFRWLFREPSLAKVSELLEDNDPLNFYDGIPSEQKLYSYKIKRFLAEAAMGMTSETPWLGEYDLFGGVIIAKNDGDIVCFHIYDFNLFRSYLLNNTKFEQPATGEDGNNPGNRKKTGKKYYYGWLENDLDDLIFKINLQIRFK
ncbi:HpaII restriction endonuclease [Winogradskyella pacifica]|uniref:HpaII restriction endonuclease n=1 Tax=Winogradskyella pacifica TaxID=664642 RepID=A0A3D9MAJ3_9FLAO|nr:HpaII family restriction endonuclease [Winogradskyella pacifica]REE16842.1 HpaII restriction endonuclease [Winogradskyella pacifica]